MSATLAITAYESGQVAGEMVVLGLVAAVIARIFRGWIRATFPRTVRIVLAFTTAGLLFLIALHGTRDNDPEKVRAERVAGCVSTGAPMPVVANQAAEACAAAASRRSG